MVLPTGIILAGGQSSRFGGSDKSLILFNGKPLIEYPLTLLKQYCSEIIISSNNDNLKHYPYKFVKDEFPGKGPLSGIHSCLKKSKSLFNFVLSCDMPFIPGKLVEIMLSGTGNYDLVIPFHNGFYEPMCAVYSCNLIPVIEKLLISGNTSPLNLTESEKCLKIETGKYNDFACINIFRNINSNKDLTE